MTAKSIILQISKANDQNFWINSAPGVWMIRLNDVNYALYENWLLLGISAEDYSSITSVIFDNVFLNEVNSIAGCNAALSSYYVSTTELYIHTPGNQYPDNHEVKVGAGRQYRKGGQRYINGQDIEERLASVPTLSKEIGDIFEGKLVFSGGSPELINADGELDTLLDSGGILGNKAIAYQVTQAGEWERLFSGFVVGGRVDTERLALTIKNDFESLLNIDIPENFFDSTTYPDIDDNHKGKPIPLLFGNIRNLEIVCTNDLDGAPVNYNFVVADISIAQIHDIIDVKVDGGSVAFTKSLATNSFTIAAINYTPGQTVTADIEGFQDSSGDMITRASDIIKFLFNTFLLFTDTSDFYRVWNRINSYDIYLVVNSVRPLSQIVEEACRSSFLTLVHEDSGAFSLIANFKGDYYLSELQDWDLISIEPAEYGITTVLSSVTVKFNKDHKNLSFYQYSNTGFKEEIRGLYNQYNHKEIELNLTTELDAYNASTQILEYFQRPWQTCVVKISIDSARSLYLGYNYAITFKRPKAPNIGRFIVKLVKTDKNLNAFTVNLTLLLVKRLYPLVEAGSPVYDDCLYDDCLYGGADYEEVLS